ncbi:MAG: ion transporter [Lachnospiraceae bacterium]
MRERLFEIIEVSKENDKLSRIYDNTMIFVIIASIVPLCFKTESPFLILVDEIAVSFFIVDYFVRWITCDFRYKGKSKYPFLRFVISPMAIIDLLAILPSISIASQTLKVFRVLRFFRTFRVLKFLRYSKSFARIINVLKNESETLGAVLVLGLGYIFVTGLLMFQVEPENFTSLFAAIYWSTTALTTVGYGDIYPITNFGRTISMISSLMGIAIVALPAGIITGGYLEEIKEEREKKDE